MKALVEKCSFEHFTPDVISRDEKYISVCRQPRIREGDDENILSGMKELTRSFHLWTLLLCLIPRNEKYCSVYKMRTYQEWKTLPKKKFILELWFSWDNTHEWRVMYCIQTRIRAITDESIIIWNDGVNQNCSFENFITPHVIFRNETYYSL